MNVFAINKVMSVFSHLSLFLSLLISFLAVFAQLFPFTQLLFFSSKILLSLGWCFGLLVGFFLVG